MRGVVRHVGPVVGALVTLAAILGEGRPLPLVGGLLYGLMWWTLIEYLLHRFVLHWEPREPRWRRLRAWLPGHRSHHDGPHDADDVVSNRHAFGIPLGLVLLLAMLAIGFALPFALAALAGGAAGYVAYEYVHFSCHQLRIRSRAFAWLRRHHGLHHHRDETVNFGVTSPVWDWVFGTYWRPERPSRAG
jgi:sterol desaturase/sphingolipid hydroxylase (fatty acid hydroxylase superfamily)